VIRQVQDIYVDGVPFSFRDGFGEVGSGEQAQAFPAAKDLLVDLGAALLAVVALSLIMRVVDSHGGWAG
jgi:hypothetical protein